MTGMLAWLGGWAFGLSLVLTPIVRDIFSSYGLTDAPDGARKMHRKPIPRVGGIAVAISYFGSFWLVARYPGGLDGRQVSLVWTLLPSALVIFAIGLIDDFLGLKPWQKLAGQLGAAALAYWSGFRMTSFGGQEMGWWNVPVTMLWLLLCTNAFNLVDGLDGLAAGVGFFATLTTFTAAVLQHQTELACATLPLAGCLLAFLCFNFNPATIFLGDGGSLLIGFLLGSYALVWSQKSVTLLGITAPLMALSIPLLDVVLSVMRRFLRNRPIFTADRSHIHHRLIDRGLTPRRAVLLVYAVSGFAALCALVQSFTGHLYLSLLVVLLFCGLAWLGVDYLSYSEFVLAGRLFRAGEFQRALNTQLMLDNFSAALDAAADVPACWEAIRAHYRNFGFCGVRMRVNGISYQDGDAAPDPAACWTAAIPLSAEDSIELAREFESHAPATAVGPTADLLRSAVARHVAAAKAARQS